MTLRYLQLTAALKETPRRGWVYRKVPSPESVGDHSKQVTNICELYPWEHKKDQQRAVAMAQIHDLGEAVIGDIIPADKIARGATSLKVLDRSGDVVKPCLTNPDEDVKRNREALVIEFIVSTLANDHPEHAKEIRNLWEEYESGETPVAKVVHEADKLEALLQAFIYTKQYPDLDLNDFRDHATKIKDTWLLQRATEVLADWDALQERRRSSGVRVIFVIGGPGVGKGTQCKAVADGKNVVHISAGDLLREEQEAPGSQYGDFIRRSIAESVVVPATLTTELLMRQLERLWKTDVVVLLDGFPRSVQQLEEFEKEVGPYSTIFLDCPEEILQVRLTERAKLSGRGDDNVGTIAKRLQTHRGSMRDLLQALGKKPLETINCSCTIEEVRVEFQHAVEKLAKQNVQLK